MKGSRTGNFSDPQSVQCSRMCGMPVEFCGTVLKWTLKALVSSEGFSMCNHCALQCLCLRCTAFARLSSGTAVDRTTCHPCGSSSLGWYLSEELASLTDKALPFPRSWQDLRAFVERAAFSNRLQPLLKFKRFRFENSDF